MIHIYYVIKELVDKKAKASLGTKSKEGFIS